MQQCLEGTHELSRSIELDARLVRNPTEFPIHIGSVQGSASLPELRAGAFGRSRLVTPPLLRAGKPAGWSDGRGRNTIWGQTWGDRVEEEVQVRVTRLAVRFPLPDDRSSSAAQTAEHLFESICSWSARLSKWVKVVTLDDRPSPPIALPRHTGAKEHCGLQLQHVDQAGNRTAQLSWMPLPIGEVRAVKSLTESSWWAVLDRVNAGIDPPTERLLLGDARAQLEREPARRAVLDSATAAEIALTQMLDDQLRSLPPSAAEFIRREARQLVPIARTLRDFGVDLPQARVKELAEVRNRAIHKGHPPSLKEGRAAFLLARDLIEQARPLNDLLGDPIGRREPAE